MYDGVCINVNSWYNNGIADKNKLKNISDQVCQKIRTHKENLMFV